MMKIINKRMICRLVAKLLIHVQSCTHLIDSKHCVFQPLRSLVPVLHPIDLVLAQEASQIGTEAFKTMMELRQLGMTIITKTPAKKKNTSLTYPCYDFAHKK